MNQTPRERARKAIEAIANGSTLKSALADASLSGSTLNAILSSDRELALAYGRALEIRADLYADEIIVIADDENKDPHRARNQIGARQWVASKHNARRYGERIDLNVTQTIDIGSTLAEARARIVRPVSDQLIIDHEETQAIQPKITLKPSDN